MTKVIEANTRLFFAENGRVACNNQHKYLFKKSGEPFCPGTACNGAEIHAGANGIIPAQDSFESHGNYVGRGLHAKF